MPDKRHATSYLDSRFCLEIAFYPSAQIGSFEDNINDCFYVADFISGFIPLTFNHVHVDIALV